MLLILAVGLPLAVAARAQCPPGDFNGDCQVDMADLALFADQWLTTCGTGSPNALDSRLGARPAPGGGSLDSPAEGGGATADLSHDGRVDGADLALFGAHWRQKSCPIVINELLAHAHAEASDWIELHNISSVAVHVGGWFLSDSRNDLMKYQIAAGTTIGPRGYLVLYETLHFANPLDPGMRRPFAFTENGETVYLSSDNDEVFPGYVMEQSFGASETGYPFGRYRTSRGTYDFVAMSEPTPGAANAYPRVGPVVIEEIMYHPQIDANAEYVELLNISGEAVTLFDFLMMLPWRLTDDTGISVRLPADPPVTLQPGEPLLLIHDAAALLPYHVPAGVQTIPWGSGKLDNAGGRLRLLKPGDVDESGTQYWIVVDTVNYSDGSHEQRFPDGIDPWPVEADGSGSSLTRLAPARYGNDPNNWHAALPTPGSVHD
jgi:hypothetical protein